MLLLRFDPPPSPRLESLQRRDDDKVANEQARNNLESHIFETKDAMYSDLVISVSTEEQREVILSALNEAGDWMEDDGYFAETKVRVWGCGGVSVWSVFSIQLCCRE